MRAFVGRADELAELRRALAAARSGRPRVLLIEGEPGIGKSSLLAQFVSVVEEATVLRASCDESELWLGYGVVTQLVASARAAGFGGTSLLDGLREELDPLAVGAELLGFLGDVQRTEEPVLVVVDDLHWADRPSARALLFALRRLHGDRVLVLLSARTGGPSRLGDGWRRFLAGDHRAERIPLAGFEARDVAALGVALGIGEVPGVAVRALLDHTGGNPLYCRALLEELGSEGLARAGTTIPAPRALAGLIVDRLSGLTPPAQRFVIAAATLGRPCELAAAAALAELDDPVGALGEAVQAELLIEQPGANVAQIRFVHPLVQSAVYDHLSPVARRRLHERAAGLVNREAALAHRVAAAVGADDALAGELEAAARQARRDGRLAQAGEWLAEAASLAGDREHRDRLTLDAMEALLACGEVAQAEALVPAVVAARRSAKQAALLGELDMVAGRTQQAEARLARAWESHDRVSEAVAAAGMATTLGTLALIAGRVPEALLWGERAQQVAETPESLRHRAAGVLGLTLWTDRRESEALASFSFLPARPSDVPPQETDPLVLRGMLKLHLEDLEGAIGDLATCASRVRAGVPARYTSQCLSFLSEAEYRLGSWDDALMHGELAVSVAHDADRAWDFAYVHSFATSVPAGRGDWSLAQAHVEAAKAGASALGAADAIAAAATAQARLATARGDFETVLDAASAVRASGKAGPFGRPERYEWRPLEVEALLGLGRFDDAADALAELDAALSPSNRPPAVLAAARLRAALTSAVGDAAAAATAFQAAWRHAADVRLPLPLALLEIADARHHRHQGRRDQAVALLRSARRRLVHLGGWPYVEICDRELADCGARVLPEQRPETVGLTPAELAVARLVATGCTNREAAAALYVSVKAVEFHLSHIFAKLGISSRRELSDQLSGSLRGEAEN